MRPPTLATLLLTSLACSGAVTPDPPVPDAATALPEAEAPPDDAPTEGWLFEGPRGDFRIVFPAEPEVSVEMVPTALGELQMLSAVLEVENDFWGVATNDVPFAPPDRTDLVHGARDGMMEAMDGTITGETTVTAAGHEGLEFSFGLPPSALPPSGAIGMARVFLVGHTQYQVLTFAAPERWDEQRGRRFLASFEPSAR